MCDSTDAEHIAKFTGDDMTYREIVRDERAVSASKIWPCFSKSVFPPEPASSGENPLANLVPFL